MALTVVIGGTGNVGQGVVPALLASGQQVRVLTRNPDGDVARGQGEAGAEIAKGDLGDVASLEAALEGSTVCTWPPRPPINKRNRH